MARYSSGVNILLSFILFLSIFRRPYYISWFLPALLRPRVVSTFFFLTLPPRSVFVERWFAPNLPVFLLQLPKAPDVCMAFIDSLKRYGGSSVLFCGLCLHNVWLSIRLPEALTPCLRNAACWLTLLAGLRGQTRLWLAGCGCSSLSVWVNVFSSVISPISMGKTII